MLTRAVVATAVAAACLAAPPAEAKHRKPLSGSYPLVLPVPFPAESSTGSHCSDAPEDVSRDARTFGLPGPGKLKLQLSGHVGDWVVELFDTKGAFLTSAGGVTTPDAPISLTYRNKARAATKIVVMVCNYAGGPEGHVAWTYTFD